MPCLIDSLSSRRVERIDESLDIVYFVYDLNIVSIQSSLFACIIDFTKDILISEADMIDAIFW